MATEQRHFVDVGEFVKTVYKKQSTVMKIANSSIALSLLNRLVSFPKVDAVEVVRCKDCKSWEQYNACDGSKPHRCMNLNAIFHMRTAPDDFCSYGERRTDHV